MKDEMGETCSTHNWS